MHYYEESSKEYVFCGEIEAVAPSLLEAPKKSHEPRHVRFYLPQIYMQCDRPSNSIIETTM